MGRASLGTFRSTALGIVMAGGKLTPAKVFLDNRQARYAQRLLARPAGHKGPEEMLSRAGSVLGPRFLRLAHVALGEAVERHSWPRTRTFPGQVIEARREEALEEQRGRRTKGIQSGRMGLG